MKVRLLGFLLMSLGLLLSGGLMELLHRTELHHAEFLRPSRNPLPAVVLTAGPLLVALAGWLHFITGKRLRDIEAACAPSARGCLVFLVLMLAIGAFVFGVLGVALSTGILRYEP